MRHILRREGSMGGTEYCMPYEGKVYTAEVSRNGATVYIKGPGPEEFVEVPIALLRGIPEIHTR